MINYKPCTKEKRNIGLDLFRIVMMFGICLIHACGQGAYKSTMLHIKSLGRANGIVRLIAPSMFGVYLLHCALYFPGVGDECYGLINYLMSWHVNCGWTPFIAYFIVAFEVFTISLAVDLVRRCTLYPMRNRIKWFLDEMDYRYDRIGK